MNTKRSYQELKATPNQIRIRTSAIDNEWVEVAIADNGIGMPERVKQRIFDPFFTTKEVGKGTGLGLSTALGIVKNHGGFVKVYSEVGRGSQFKVYLPAIEDAVTQPAAELALLTGNNELILIVEDELSIQQVTRC